MDTNEHEQTGQVCLRITLIDANRRIRIRVTKQIFLREFAQLAGSLFVNSCSFVVSFPKDSFNVLGENVELEVH
jgi:hypothetical protein